ncbi:hypothetical protein G7Z12_06805 [Streptomyces sp. ID38640]|uniref:enoyl-CoA hydratase/isomerase family protein n=1 Tax=Streptomyces sp. ID38640 TaxID=1265399 RepID=UPI00140ED9D6|nr:enoyl-CoA hydratase-related protein [Streptomyces sp. ID38640]QIK05791.1 hypothetical protein G7Z12_06805 [Streptomyces sp. ID38640]
MIIMLDRLEPFNTLSADLQRELHAVLDASAADLSVRVMVVIGAGRGFCTGLDLTDFDMSGPGSAKHTPQSGMAVQVRLAALVSKPRAQPQVVIATPGLVRERQLRILPRYRTTATPIRPETGPTTTGALSEAS